MINSSDYVFRCSGIIEGTEDVLENDCRSRISKAVKHLPGSAEGWFEIYDLTTRPLSSHMGHLGRFWPNIEVKRKIRSLLTHRILGLTSNPGHNLRQEIKTLEIKARNYPLEITVSQTDVTSYTEGSKVSTSTNKKDQITVEGQARPNSDPDPDDDGDDNPEQAYEDNRKVGIIYARVSSDGQTSDDNDNMDDENPDEGSIQGQISELVEIAHDEGIALPYDPFIDEAKTGTNFDREAIQRVFEVCKQKDIDYLLVEKIDRIGRNAPETLYFISQLQRECGVTLITPKGEQDIEEVKGLMHTTLMSLMAEVQNTIRTKKATKERIRGFLEKKNWNCKSPTVPLGYSETEDGWLKVDPEEKPIVQEIFEKFIECEKYAATERHIEAEFGSKSIEGHSVKTVLQESAYIGRPKVPEDWLEGMPFENDLYESELRLLGSEDDNRGEEIFEKVQAVIKKKDQVGSTDEETHTIEDFIKEFGLFATVESSIPVKLVHHCGEPLVKDGQVDLGGKYDIRTHRYKCPKCEAVESLDDYYRKWPLQFEAEKMEIMNDLLNGDEIFGKSAGDSNSDKETESDSE